MPLLVPAERVNSRKSLAASRDNAAPRPPARRDRLQCLGSCLRKRINSRREPCSSSRQCCTTASCQTGSPTLLWVVPAERVHSRREPCSSSIWRGGQAKTYIWHRTFSTSLTLWLVRLRRYVSVLRVWLHGFHIAVHTYHIGGWCPCPRH